MEEAVVSGGDGVQSRLLVICTANVCRSPLAERILQRGLGESGAVAGLQVRSAGVRARADWPMCAVSARALDDATDDEFVSAHRSTLVTKEMVRDADLVIAMEREHRSAIAQLAPGSQSKVFTLREAEGLLGVLEARGAEPPADLAALARALHSVRGFAPQPPEAPKRRWFQRPLEPDDPLTIVDGHGYEDERHEAAVRTVHATTERVAAAIRSVMALSPSR